MKPALLRYAKCIFSQSICLCSQGNVRQGTEKIAAGDVVPPSLRGAVSADSFLGCAQGNWGCKLPNTGCCMTTANAAGSQNVKFINIDGPNNATWADTEDSE